MSMSHMLGYTELNERLQRKSIRCIRGKDMDILSKKNLVKDGKIQRWPSKKVEKDAVLLFIASQIPPDGKLPEKEINKIIMQNILFDDFALIRRELIERGHLARTRDCREYWRTGEGNVQS